MRTLREDGASKAFNGHTTVEEVLRVTRDDILDEVLRLAGMHQVCLHLVATIRVNPCESSRDLAPCRSSNIKRSQAYG